MKRPIAMLLELLLTASLFAFSGCGEDSVSAVQSSVVQIQSAESSASSSVPESQSTLPSVPEEQSTLPSVPEEQSTLPSVPEEQSTVESFPLSSSEPQSSASLPAESIVSIHTHQPGDYRSDTAQHWQICADCQQELPDTRSVHQETAGTCVCGSPHVHSYDSACDADCNGCGLVREVSPHVYKNDCDAICDVENCSYVRIPTHYLSEATCFAPKTCSKCRLTFGKSLGHSWSKNRCLITDYCTRCGTEGFVMHTFEGDRCIRCEAPYSRMTPVAP